MRLSPNFFFLLGAVFETLSEHGDLVHRSRVLLVSRAFRPSTDDVERFLAGSGKGDAGRGTRRRNDSEVLSLWAEDLNAKRGGGVEAASRVDCQPVGPIPFELSEVPPVSNSAVRLDIERQHNLGVGYVQGLLIAAKHDPVRTLNVTGKPDNPAGGVDVIDRGRHPATLGEIHAALLVYDEIVRPLERVAFKIVRQGRARRSENTHAHVVSLRRNDTALGVDRESSGSVCVLQIA